MLSAEQSPSNPDVPNSSMDIGSTPMPKEKGWLDSITGGNQFMSAGLGVMAVGAGLAVARQSVRRAAGFAKHQMLGRYHTRDMSVSFGGKDEANPRE